MTDKPTEEVETSLSFEGPPGHALNWVLLTIEIIVCVLALIVTVAAIVGFLIVGPVSAVVPLVPASATALVTLLSRLRKLGDLLKEDVSVKVQNRSTE